MSNTTEPSTDWIDVTVPIQSNMVNWPGDIPVKVEKKQDMAKGDAVNLSIMSMSLHTGTHMDAPKHFIKSGVSLDELPMDAVVGPVRVIENTDPVSIKVETLEPIEISPGERILFKTRNSSTKWCEEPFNEDFVFISQDAARYLVEKQVQTVGIDYLSVGGYKVDGLETHNHLLGAGIWLIEGLDLSQIESGSYQMICLPVRILGAEGSPARVILKKLK